MEMRGRWHGVLCSIAINCQVRSFCNYSSIPPYLDDSPFFPSFVRLSFSLNLFFPRTCSLCLVNIFSFSFYSISSSPPLWVLSWTNRNSGYRLHPFLAAPDHDLFGGCLGSPLNCGSICLIFQSELSSTPTPTSPSIPISIPASISYPSCVLVNHEFQQQAGSSPSFRLRQTQST